MCENTQPIYIRASGDFYFYFLGSHDVCHSFVVLVLSRYALKAAAGEEKSMEFSNEKAAVVPRRIEIKTH